MSQSSRTLPEIVLPHRVSLGNFPTRIQRLDRLSASMRSPELFIKRDDETGSDLSGNKVRKLEFLLAQAQERGADLIVTCGGVQSNHCRATAVAARRVGMDSLLFLRGEDPKDRDGNLLLEALVGAELRFVSPETYGRRSEVMAQAAEEARAQGRRPYVIPEGGSNALGSFGYISFLSELIEQGIPGGKLSPAQIGTGTFPWDHIVCAVGSGGTLAGLLIGRKLLGLQTQIWGVNVCDSAAYFQQRVLEIAAEFARTYLHPPAEDSGPGGGTSLETIGPHSLDPLLEPEEIRILEGYKGPAYAQCFPEELELIREVARRDGILLDPVYTGKAVYGMLEEARRGRFGQGKRLLFLHTGGIFSLYPYRQQLLEG